MISFVRDYISTQIVSVDPRLEQWTDAFNIENIPSTIYDNAYHIFYSVPTMDKEQGLVDLSISSTITLFFKANRDVQTIFDTAMDTGNSVAIALMNVHNIQEYNTVNDLQNYIISVDVNSVLPTNPDSNDNRVIITLDADINIKQSIC